MSSGDGAQVACPLFQVEGGGSIPTSPLQFHIRECSVDTARRLNAIWHSVLPETNRGNLLRNRKCVFYVAEYENMHYAVAIWTTPIAANRLKEGFVALELRRFAISPDAPKNTASRMLRIMTALIRKKFPDTPRLVSYQARDHHGGTIYKAAGWKAVAESDYATWHEGQVRNAPQTKSSKVRWELTL